MNSDTPNISPEQSFSAHGLSEASISEMIIVAARKAALCVGLRADRTLGHSQVCGQQPATPQEHEDIVSKSCSEPEDKGAADDQRS
jgi:hypothetical protein